MLFTEEQLQELEKVFGLSRKESLPVKDGRVNKDGMIWWRCEDGPTYTPSITHWNNIKEYPNLYSLAEPKTSITYLD